VLLAATLAACGGPDICLQCPSGGPTPAAAVTVTGSGLQTTPSQTPSNVTVIVCLDLKAGGTPDDCGQSFFADVTTDGSFTRNNVSPGPETIFFWVDANGNGMVDPTDPIATLSDSQGALGLVQAGQTVTLSNISVNFNTTVATANISVTTTPTPVPTTRPSPTPQPT
jgi:hypothetical protein